AGSDGPPIVARNEVEPAGMLVVYSCCAWFAIVNTPLRALPSGEPTACPVNDAKLFWNEYDRGTGTPTWALAITSGFGVTTTPNSEAVSVYGAQSVSDVRLASTVTSQTPASAPSTVRLSGLPVAQAPAGGA